MRHKFQVLGLMAFVVLIVVSCVGVAQAIAEQPMTPAQSLGTPNVAMNYGGGGKAFLTPWYHKAPYLSTTNVYDQQTGTFVPCEHAGCMKIITLRGRHGMQYIAFKSKPTQRVIYGSFSYIDRNGVYSYSSNVWGGIPVPTSIKVVVDGFPSRLRLYYASAQVYDPSLSAPTPVPNNSGTCEMSNSCAMK
ncbi:MAG: hypothetical protein WA843_02210 [Candidatus Saccharimonadales bacterium]